MNFINLFLLTLLIFGCSHSVKKPSTINDENFGVCGCRAWDGSKPFEGNLILVDDGEKSLLKTEAVSISSKSNNFDYLGHQKGKSYRRTDKTKKTIAISDWKCVSSAADTSGPSSVSNEYSIDIKIKSTTSKEIKLIEAAGYCGC